MRRAKRSLEEALDISRKALPSDDPDIADSPEQPGQSCSMICVTTRRAKQSHEDALAIFRKSLPPDDPKIAASLSNLGTVQRELRDYAACEAEP